MVVWWRCVAMCVSLISAAQRRSPVAHSIKLNARGPNCTSACDSILACIALGAHQPANHTKLKRLDQPLTLM